MGKNNHLNCNEIAIFAGFCSEWGKSAGKVELCIGYVLNCK